MTLAVGASGTLQVVGNYSTGTQFYMYLPLVSSNTAVATVSGNTVTAVGGGSADITAGGYLETDSTACPYEFSPPGDPEYCPMMADLEADAPVDALTIKTITPSKGLAGSSLTVTIKGTGFASGDIIQAGPSITVSNISITSSTEISATFTVQNSPDAGGPWNVTVSSGDQTSNGAEFFVQVPTSLQVVNVAILPNGTGKDKGCGPDVGGSFGIRVDVKYQVLDQQSTPQAIADASMVPHERVENPPVDQDICPSTVPTCTHTTAADGTWHDAPYGACFSQPFSVQFSQRITMIVNGTAYARADEWCNRRLHRIGSRLDQQRIRYKQVSIRGNMKRLFVVLIILVGSQQWSLSQADTQDPYSEKLVAYLASGNGPVFSMQEKLINRLGDGAALGLIRHIGPQAPTTPHEIERILFVIRMAFAAPEIISSDADREPKSTLFLLSYLNYLPASSNLKGEIQNTRGYVEQQINDYKLKHAIKKD